MSACGALSLQLFRWRTASGRINLRV